MGDVMNDAIARLKSNDPTLTTLNLIYKHIGAAGASAIANALRTNNALTTLDLWSNNIGDAGASVIANALRKNGMITSFSPESDTTLQCVERNKSSHSRALAAAIAVAGIKRFRIPGIPIDIFRQIARHIWGSRHQPGWRNAGVKRFHVMGIPVDIFRQMARHIWISRHRSGWWNIE